MTCNQPVFLDRGVREVETLFTLPQSDAEDHGEGHTISLNVIFIAMAVS